MSQRVPERRTEPRLWCSHLIHVRVEDGSGRTLTANLEDVSPSGACVQTEGALEVGTPVCLNCGNLDFRGIVRYAVVNEVGHFAGVQFTGKKWSREAFEPEHLLDPGAVPGRPPVKPTVH